MHNCLRWNACVKPTTIVHSDASKRMLESLHLLFIQLHSVPSFCTIDTSKLLSAHPSFRHSVGGYHRSLSRSKPGFESPWRVSFLDQLASFTSAVTCRAHRDTSSPSQNKTTTAVPLLLLPPIVRVGCALLPRGIALFGG